MHSTSRSLPPKPPPSGGLPERLLAPLQFFKGVGPRRAEALAAMGLKTAWDVLSFYPKKHYDRGRIRKIAQLKIGTSETLQGVVMSMDEGRTRDGKQRFTLSLQDETGSIDAVWWGRRYLNRAFRVGDVVLLTGRVERFRKLQIMPDDFEILSNEDYEPIHAVGWVPSYGPMDPVGRKVYRRLTWELSRTVAPEVPDYLPDGIVRRRGLMSEADALRSIHFPATGDEKERARRRLAYDEFFLLELMLARRKRGAEQLRTGRALRISDALDFRIRTKFPFKLTPAQDRVVGELRRELSGLKPMNRLLQGDVGSGKTVVAAYAVLAAVGNHGQAAVMAPTEILAEQHFRTFSRILEGSRVRIAFLGGGRSKGRSTTIAKIAAGEVDLVIGTHALVEDKIAFKDLALAVVDEQQKFGVMQRAALRRKGSRPHVLVMTATPIPRTLALTLYGDLDVSVIDQMPPGRKPVKTRFVPDEGRADALRFVRTKLREGRQAYFVYPLVEESDELPFDSATRQAEKLAKEFPESRVALLHGRMAGDEKDRAMEEFRAGRAHILVSTLVVEVGIDVPNATVMVIGDCERYGLSQLHQLRGRIGRGPQEGYCLLFGRPKSEESRARIDAVVASSDGFKIAEADLRLRGPGEFLGTKQSGLPEFQAADLIRDLQLLGWAREDAFAVADPPPPFMMEMLRLRFGGKPSLLTVG